MYSSSHSMLLLESCGTCRTCPHNFLCVQGLRASSSSSWWSQLWPLCWWTQLDQRQQTRSPTPQAGIITDQPTWSWSICPKSNSLHRLTFWLRWQPLCGLETFWQWMVCSRLESSASFVDWVPRKKAYDYHHHASEQMQTNCQTQRFKVSTGLDTLLYLSFVQQRTFIFRSCCTFGLHPRRYCHCHLAKPAIFHRVPCSSKLAATFVLRLWPLRPQCY